MTDRLHHKVCIVTGGGAGLGEAISRLFAEQGAHVVVMDINKADAHRVADDIKRDGGSTLAIEADVTNEDDVKKVIQTASEITGVIDVLINNAAVGGADYNYNVVDAPMDVWERCMNVNMRGTFLCMKHAIPHMQKVNRGSIVNIGSISSVVGLGTQSMYAPTKAGVLQLSRQAAIDYAPHIRINCILPGGMNTPMTQREIEATQNKQLIEKELEMLPMGRFADPREVAWAVLFLASDEASFITGASLAVDGGYTAQ